MPEIHFYRKYPANKKNGKVLISLQMNYHGERLRMSTKETILPQDWDHKKELPRKNYRYYTSIKGQLEKYEQAVMDAYRDMVDSGVFLNEKELKAAVLVKLQPKTKPIDLLAYTEKFIAERTASPKYKEGSIEVYSSLYNDLKDYKSYIPFESIDSTWLQGFRDYQYTFRKEQNTVAKKISTLRTILNEATELGINTSLKYKSRRGSVGKVDTTKIFNSEAELLLMWQTNLSPALTIHRDIYLVQAYTGVRFQNIESINRVNFREDNGDQYFMLVQHKTKDVVAIPLHPMVLHIMEKYDWKLPDVKNQKYNKALKIIGRKAKIDQQITVTSHPGGVYTQSLKAKYSMISSHTARRSLICNMYIAGVPVQTIMKVSGHKTFASFMTYMRLTPTEHLKVVALSDWGKTKLLQTG